MLDGLNKDLVVPQRRSPGQLQGGLQCATRIYSPFFCSDIQNPQGPKTRGWLQLWHLHELAFDGLDLDGQNRGTEPSGFKDDVPVIFLG